MPFSSSAIVILGASGDLAQRKLIPALQRLHLQGSLEGLTAIVGEGRSELTTETFRSKFTSSDGFSALLSYHQGISGLRQHVQSRGSFSRIIVFMALPPAIYGATAAELAAEGFGEESILVVEKPFGHDLESARQLNRDLARHFDERRIFRIDHYLAKEAVQNILVFRFANSVFYPVWNSRYIESIQINASEEIGVEGRGAYFDDAGIIRDMVQNHLMQLLCLVTMEAPATLDAEEVRCQKLSILKSLRVADCRRMQYRGYHQEKGVTPGSATETYAELKLFIDTFRWVGMPIYIRTGKALDRRGTEIGVQFRGLPRLLFNREGQVEPNRIVFKIQPAEGIVLDLSSKAPGDGVRLTDTSMKFCYRDAFEGEIPEAYQKLLLDAIRGDRTLFISAEETELSWQRLAPALGAGDLGYYDRGTDPASQLCGDCIDFGKYASVCV